MVSGGINYLERGIKKFSGALFTICSYVESFSFINI